MKKIKLLLGLFLATILFVVACNPEPQNVSDAPETTEQASSTQESSLSVTPFYASAKGALVASTMIEGESEMILVDAQYIPSEATKLVEKVKAKGKDLKAIWISHGHPDHYLALSTVLEAFPDTPVYATAECVEVMNQRTATYVESAKNNPGFADEEIPDNPIIAEVFTEDSMELDGETIEIMDMVGDTKNVGALYIPSLKTLIATDVVYSGVHVFMIESNTPEVRQAWMSSLDTIKELNLEKLIPGHKAPDVSLDDPTALVDNMAKYIETYGGAVTSKGNVEEAKAEITTAFPDYQVPFLLDISLNAAYANQ